jgi:hypothetical protein
MPEILFKPFIRVFPGPMNKRLAADRVEEPLIGAPKDARYELALRMNILRGFTIWLRDHATPVVGSVYGAPDSELPIRVRMG